MKKFLVSDYDRTFYLDDEDIKNNVKRVKEFRDKGNIFAIATGRSLYTFNEIIDKYKIEYDYLILNSGATILNKEHEIIGNYPINNKIKEEIRKELNLKDDGKLFVSKCLESKISIKENDITKINIICDNKKDQTELNDILNTKYHKYIKSYIISGQNNSIEIISSKTSKAEAISKVANIEDINKENIYTVGDSYNDLEMLEKFNGICMENSEEFVKTKINRKCSKVIQVIDEIM